MKMHFSQPRINRGLSIVELMVAVTIGLLLMGGAISIFVSNKNTYEITDDLSRLQENARYAIATMARDIRMVGFFGCADNPLGIENQLTVATAGNLYDVNNTVEGFEQGAGTWAPSGRDIDQDKVDNPALPAITMVGDSDAITVRYLEGVGSPLSANMTAQTSDVQIGATNGLALGDIVAVNDCSSADVLQITNIPSAGTLSHAASGTPGNSVSSLSKVYETDATVSRMGTARYFVGIGAAGGPSLFRTRFSAVGGNSELTTEELVEGVESLQILYGVDNVNGDRAPDTYVDAANVTNWANVVTVRVGLLMRTVDEYGPVVDETVYTVNGTAVDPVDDRRRRRVFETTLAMRNLQ